MSAIFENYPLFFAICFVCFLIRTTYNYAYFKSKRIKNNKVLLTLVFISMFFLWFSWFHMNFSDPIRVEYPSIIKYSGLFLFVSGILLFVISLITKRGLSNEEILIKTGVFAKIRNPMYLSFLIWLVALPVYMGSGITLASSIIWIVHVLLWKHFEEKDLLDRISDYAEYRKNTWF